MKMQIILLPDRNSQKCVSKRKESSKRDWDAIMTMIMTMMSKVAILSLLAAPMKISKRTR